MGFVYPRTIAVTRPAAQTGVGFKPAYAGAKAAAETPIAKDLRASIQARREGQRNPVGLPGDGTRPTFYVFIPRRAAALGLIKNLDIITDDLGARYQVLSPYWNSLGHRLTVELLDP